METSHPRPSPRSLVPKNDSGLWMKVDSDHTESPSVTCGERPKDEASVTPPAAAVIPRYYSVMDDEVADDVFVPPPPSHSAPSRPAESSTDATVHNSSVTLTNGAADATEAKANPSGLDWHRGEKQLMAAHNEGDEGITSVTQTSKESVDTVSLYKDKGPKDQDQTSMEGTSSLMETCYDPSGGRPQDNTTGDRESNEELEDVVILGEGQENWRQTEVESDKYPKQVPSSIEETDSKLSTENVDCEGVETSAPTLSRLSVKDDDFESCGPPELSKSNQNKMDSATNQPQVPEIPTEVTNDDEEHVDTRSLNYNLTKSDWVRRESGTCETQEPRLSVSESSEEMQTKGELGDGSKRISIDIQQGEQLLQRLQQVQLRQDECIPESTRTSQQVVQETRGEVDDLKGGEGDLKGGDEKEESRFHTVEDEGAKTNLKEKEKNESKDVETKARTSSPTMPAEPEHHVIARAEAGDSDDNQSDSWVPADLSQIDPHETSSSQVPLLSTHHRFSATDIEVQIHEADQGEQNMQRADGVFNLADNPDVLEIPFKTNISLETLPTKVGPGQCSDWQFSGQKMQKEISREIQRELVLVNQGKIPGGYSKGEARQLKETKLLFEAFQQDNTEGPTRHRKIPTSLKKGHLYPSVLERTHSLEMLSLKSCPISRAHSFRLYKSATTETERSPEDLRSKSPTLASVDKTRLSPYPKQDVRLCRSMDSINTDDSTSAVEARSKTSQGNMTQESPILKHNPFFKLRPALALQPEVEKDIREAKEREEELRRQRCSLYGENWQNSEDGEKSQFTPTLVTDARKQSRGKLERVWPPPSMKDQMKSEQTQQDPKVPRAGGQKAPLWQRWECGLINGQPPKENN